MWRKWARVQWKFIDYDRCQHGHVKHSFCTVRPVSSWTRCPWKGVQCDTFHQDDVHTKNTDSLKRVCTGRTRVKFDTYQTKSVLKRNFNTCSASFWTVSKMSIWTCVGRYIVIYPLFQLASATHQNRGTLHERFYMLYSLTMTTRARGNIFYATHVTWHINFCTECQISLDGYQMAVRYILRQWMVNGSIRRKLDGRKSPVSDMRRVMFEVCVAVVNG